MKTMTPPSGACTLYVGLDVAKLTLQLDLAGRGLALANISTGHRALLAHLRRLRARTGRPTHVVCEGFPATLIHPKRSTPARRTRVGCVPCRFGPR